jgi:GDP-4-dehydro-6-deoxy-D-mannose reductase
MDIQPNKKFQGNYEYISCDPFNTESLFYHIQKIDPDYLLNIIGIFGAENPVDLIQINAQIPFNLLSYFSKNKTSIKKILLIGSAAEYGFPLKNPINEQDPLMPVNPYGLSKVIQTEYFKYFYHNYKLPVCIGRPFNIIGKGISSKLAIGSFYNQIRAIENDGTLLVGNLAPKRDYIYIEDVIKAYWLILTKGSPGAIYNICSGNSISMQQIVEDMIGLSNKKINIKIDTTRFRSNDVADIYGDNTKIQTELGWTCERDIKSAIKSMFQEENIL